MRLFIVFLILLLLIPFSLAAAVTIMISAQPNSVLPGESYSIPIEITSLSDLENVILTEDTIRLFRHINIDRHSCGVSSAESPTHDDVIWDCDGNDCSFITSWSCDADCGGCSYQVSLTKNSPGSYVYVVNAETVSGTTAVEETTVRVNQCTPDDLSHCPNPGMDECLELGCSAEGVCIQVPMPVGTSCTFIPHPSLPASCDETGGMPSKLLGLYC